jgi:hypothetical protein
MAGIPGLNIFSPCLFRRIVIGWTNILTDQIRAGCVVMTDQNPCRDIIYYVLIVFLIPGKTKHKSLYLLNHFSLFIEIY